MRGIYAIAGVGVLAACLAGWAALAVAEQMPGQPPADPTAPQPVAGSPAPVSGYAIDPPAVKPEVAKPAETMPATLPDHVTSAPVSSGASATPSTLPVSSEAAAEASPSPVNPTGRQEPAVSIEWIGPPVAKVGAPTDYALVVHNTCNSPVQMVKVIVKVPQGMTVQATEPKALAEGEALVWDLGTLVAKQEKNLQMRLTCEAKGDLMPKAWVSFTGMSVMSIKVREPKLILKATAPEKVLVGDAAAFTLTVTNPGDGSADGVKIHAALSEGLEHARGNKVDFEIGNLAAGETRAVQLICATKGGGVQKCEGLAEADGGLKSQDGVSVNVIQPRLELQLSGPALRYLDRKALYTLKVTNPGDAAATNVTVGDVVPAGFKVLAASDGGRHDFSTRTVSWFLGEVGPGQTREVKMEVQAVNIGEYKHHASAIGARGLRAETDMATRVEGLSALLVELVDTDDPIEVNGETSYEVRVTNTGSKPETDIKLVAMVPDKMEFKNAQSPVKFHEEAKTIVFDPIEKLAPKADAFFRINVRTTDAGTVRFKIQLTSTNITEPIIKMESTRIYADTPEGSSTSAPATMPATTATPVPAGMPH
jgi:uncharacterized repeat protein (TIGR01451 family)